MHGKNAGLAAAPFDRKRKIRRIDTDHNIRWRGEEIVQEPGPDAEQFTNSSKNLHQPHDRKTFHRHQGMKSLRNHFLPANADEPGLGIALAQRTDQAGTEDIPRCLTGDDSECNFTLADGRVRKICHRQAPAGLADDAAVSSTQGVNEGTYFCNIGVGLLKLFDGLFGCQPLAIDHLVGAA